MPVPTIAPSLPADLLRSTAPSPVPAQAPGRTATNVAARGPATFRSNSAMRGSDATTRSGAPASGREPEVVRARRERAVLRSDRERKLRKQVQRLRQCLPGLRRLQARVLVLRAGIGDYEPRTRAAVARRIDRPLRAVRRAEQRGLKRLRAARQAGTCTRSGVVAPDGAGANAGSGSESLATAGTGAAAVGLADTSADSPGAVGAGSGERGGVEGESNRSPSTRAPQPLAGPLPDPAANPSVTIPLLIGLAGIGWLVARLLRRRTS